MNLQDKIMELIAESRHNEMVERNIISTPWHEMPRDYQKKLIKSTKKRQKKIEKAMGLKISLS